MYKVGGGSGKCDYYPNPGAVVQSNIQAGAVIFLALQMRRLGHIAKELAQGHLAHE